MAARLIFAETVRCGRKFREVPGSSAGGVSGDDRIRASSPLTGVTKVIVKLDAANERDRETPKKQRFEYAWKRPGGGHAITICADEAWSHRLQSASS
jgi:hypothetical protein